MGLDIFEMDHARARRYHEELSALLVDAVAHGASVSFLSPFSMDEARSYWSGVIARLERRELFLLGAADATGLVGTTQLHVNLPPNQPHRAEVAKVIVHSRARRQGIARKLMLHVERIALREGRTLLVLDTLPDSVAAVLYQDLGYSKVGVIPGFALRPTGEMADTAIFFKQLAR